MIALVELTNLCNQGNKAAFRIQEDFTPQIVYHLLTEELSSNDPRDRVEAILKNGNQIILTVQNVPTIREEAIREGSQAAAQEAQEVIENRVQEDIALAQEMAQGGDAEQFIQWGFAEPNMLGGQLARIEVEREQAELARAIRESEQAAREQEAREQAELARAIRESEQAAREQEARVQAAREQEELEELARAIREIEQAERVQEARVQEARVQAAREQEELEELARAIREIEQAERVQAEREAEDNLRLVKEFEAREAQKLEEIRLSEEFLAEEEQAIANQLEEDHQFAQQLAGDFY